MHARLALAVLCVAQFIEVLGVTVAVVALPEIGRDLDASATTTQWVITVYALTFGGLLLLAGRAADLLGRRRVFVAGLVGFAVASLACGLAPSAPVLLAARLVQGLAAAAVVPAALALLTSTFAEGDERTRALAVWTAAAAGGGATGFLVGGLITDALGWRWIFLLNVPVALAAAGLAPRVLRESRDDGPRRLDARRIGAAAGRPGVVRASAVAFVLTATTGGAAVLITTYLQDVLGHAPATTGLLFLPFSVVVALGSLLGPRIVAATSPHATVALGLVVVGAGLLLFTRAGPEAGTAAILAGLVLSGAGLAWASVAATAIGMDAAADGEQGVVAGILNTATQLGTAAGVAALGLIASASAGADGDAGLVDGFQLAWLLAGALAIGAALAASGTGASRALVRERSGA